MKSTFEQGIVSAADERAAQETEVGASRIHEVAGADVVAQLRVAVDFVRPGQPVRGAGFGLLKRKEPEVLDFDPARNDSDFACQTRQRGQGEHVVGEYAVYQERSPAPGLDLLLSVGQ